jgi:hypothetical protein
MPLTEMSPNILEAETVTRKRSHDEFSGEFAKPVQADTQNLLPTIAITIDDRECSQLVSNAIANANKPLQRTPITKASYHLPPTLPFSPQPEAARRLASRLVP